jgi:uncharacterized protein (TIGR04255 family)
MAESTIKYPKPPIQEAVCEVHFEIPQPFTKERLEELKPVWATDYPDQKLVEEKNVELKLTPEGIKHSEQTLGHRLICRAADGKRLVQLNQSTLVVNQLRPYPGWRESFRDLILKQVNVFVKSAGTHKIRRIELRYIDKIDIPEHPVTWEKWLKLNLPTPAITGCATEGFQMQVRNKLSDDCRLTINFVSLPVTGTPPVSPVIFDFHVVWHGQPIELAALASTLETVHTPLGLAFEGYLTDNTRKLFN